MAELSGFLLTRPAPAAVCEEVVRAAVRLVPDAEEAGLSLVERKGMRSAAATSEAARRTDELQYWCREGPSLQAVEEGCAVRADALRRESRWPEFTQRAILRGVGSVLALPLVAGGESVGALILCSRGDAAFGADDERTGTLLAAHAAAAVCCVRERANLRTALESRDVIGRATGILMERRRISPQAAFSLLTEASQHMNRKLRDVAEQLVWTGDFAEPRKGRGQRPAGGKAAVPR
nr:GAF and ANTAR domain-containing protein [Streptomonospora sp. PA3]